MDPIPFRKAGDNVSSMLENASNEIVGDTDIKRTAKAARQDVNPVNSLSLGIHKHRDYWIARLRGR